MYHDCGWLQSPHNRSRDSHYWTAALLSLLCNIYGIGWGLVTCYIHCMRTKQHPASSINAGHGDEATTTAAHYTPSHNTNQYLHATNSITSESKYYCSSNGRVIILLSWLLQSWILLWLTYKAHITDLEIAIVTYKAATLCNIYGIGWGLATYTAREQNNILMMVAGFDVENKILREERKKNQDYITWENQ